MSQGVRVTYLSVIPCGNRQGWITGIRPENADREWLEKEAKGIICAWLEEYDDIDEIPQWPLDSRALTSSDEKDMARIADALQLTESGYRALILDACRLACTDVYTGIFNAGLGLTDTRPQLDERWIDAVRRSVVKRLQSEDQWPTRN